MSDSDKTRLTSGGPIPPETQLSEAIAIAERVGKDITEKFPCLAPRERRKIVAQFRHQLLPPGKPGRKRSEKITAACADWAAGMRGLALYRKHLPQFDQMGLWKRKVKTRALLDAIRTRKRREREG